MPTVIPVVELRDVVARALFQTQYRLRDFTGAKPYLKKVMYMRADDAIKRAGVKNIEVPVDSTYGNRKER